MSGRVLLVAPGLPADHASLRGLVDAAGAEGVALESLAAPATENALRKRLAAGDVGLVVYVGHGRLRQADHATLELASSSGPEPREVNLRHFAALLGGAPGLRGVVVVPREADGHRAMMGFSTRLVAHGAPAAMVWRGWLPAERARRWWRAWREGEDWTRFALLGDAPLDHATRSAQAAGRAAFEALARGGLDDLAPIAPAVVPTVPPEEPVVSGPSAIDRALEAKRAAGRFDVFLCHNSADKPAVRTIARALRARGVLPWLDEWELPPGQPWQPLLERQIEHIRSAAVFVGSAGVGPWQEQELYGFLREFVARRAPVIPVLLDNAPSVPDLPVFLRAMTYVDFRLHEPDPMLRLEWGVTGVRPDYA